MILLAAAAVRLYRVGEVPSGINWDEAAHGYNAWSIWKTGRDEWGHRFPLFLRSFGDYKSAALAYTMVPVVALFGLSGHVVRSWVALLGTLGVAGSGMLVFRLSRSKSLSLVTLSVLAVMPWNIHYSRAAMEQGLSLALLVWGFWAWFSRSGKEKWIGLGLLWGSMYAYHSTRLIIPLLLTAAILIDAKSGRKRLRLERGKLLIFGIAAAWLWWQAIFGKPGQRARDLLILSSPEIEQSVQEGYYRSSVLWGRPLRIFNNKLLIIIPDVVERYSVHFQPDFLFFQNNPDSRHAFSRGNLLLITLPFLLLGLVVSFRRLSRSDRIMLAWLLISPAAAMLTYDVPHSGRVFPMVVPLAYFAALGIIDLVDRWKSVRLRRLTMAVILVLWLGNTAWYLRDYWQYFPEESATDWQGHLAAPALYAAGHREEYDHVVFADSYNNHYLFVAWYLKLDPKEVQAFHRLPPERRDLANIDLRTVSDERLSCLLLEPKTLIVTENRITWPIPVAAKFPVPDRFHDDAVPPYVAYDGALLNENQRRDRQAKCLPWLNSESSAKEQIEWPF
jgi:hypothetical protein